MKDSHLIIKNAFEKFTDHECPDNIYDFMNKFEPMEYRNILSEVMYAEGMFPDLDEETSEVDVD